jgi:hypothetical protein
MDSAFFADGLRPFVEMRGLILNQMVVNSASDERDITNALVHSAP